MSTNELSKLLTEYKDLKTFMNEVQDNISAIEDKIKAHMGDKEEISVEGVKVKWTKYNTTRFDTKSFKAEHAAMYAQYAKASEARRFSVN